MKQSVGMTFTLNLIIIFLLIAFAFLMAIMSYSKAFRISSKIVNEIEKCEGFNSCAIPEINRILGGIGYSTATHECPEIADRVVQLHPDSEFDYCVYLAETKRYNGQNHYRYIVRTYIYYDFPLIDQIRFPINNSTNWIVNLS